MSRVEPLVVSAGGMIGDDFNDGSPPTGAGFYYLFLLAKILLCLD